MKFLVCLSLLVFSVSQSFASCKEEARNIAQEAVGVFNVNNNEIHCMAMGGLKTLKGLPVIQVMPNRYAYEATFFFPCGPQPRTPVVTMLLNSSCKLVKLEMTGHSL